MSSPLCEPDPEFQFLQQLSTTIEVAPAMITQAQERF